MVERGLEVSWIQPDEHLARTDALIVRGQDLSDEAADMGRDRGHIAADVGVIRRLDVASHGPPVVAGPSAAGEGGQSGAKETQAAQAMARLAASRSGARVTGAHGLSRAVILLLWHRHRSQRVTPPRRGCVVWSS